MHTTFCLFVFETFAFGNSSFVSRLLPLFGTIQEPVGKKTTLFQIFLLVLDEWMTVKFKH